MSRECTMSIDGVNVDISMLAVSCRQFPVLYYVVIVTAGFDISYIHTSSIFNIICVYFQKFICDIGFPTAGVHIFTMVYTCYVACYHPLPLPACFPLFPLALPSFNTFNRNVFTPVVHVVAVPSLEATRLAHVNGVTTAHCDYSTCTYTLL